MSLSPNDLSQITAYHPAADYLKGRTIMVTGASRGIGAAICKAAATSGAQIIMLARSVADMEKIADEISAAGALEPSLVPINLEAASVDDYATVAQAVSESYGHLDGLVLNAGSLGDLSPIADYDPVTWARVFQLNVHSQFLLLQATLPLLKLGKDASIVFSTSSVGRKGRAYWGAYAASKFAIEGLMETLADELEDTNIRANAVNPGATRTKMRAAAYPAEDTSKLAAPEDVATLFITLLGNAARTLNGLSLNAQ